MNGRLLTALSLGAGVFAYDSSSQLPEYDSYDTYGELPTYPEYQGSIEEFLNNYSDKPVDTPVDMPRINTPPSPYREGSRRKNLRNMIDKIVLTFTYNFGNDMNDIAKIFDHLYKETESELKNSIPKVVKMTTEYFTGLANDQLTQTQELLKSIDVMEIPGYKETNLALNKILHDGVLTDSVDLIGGRVNFDAARKNLQAVGEAAIDSAYKTGERLNIERSTQRFKEQVPIDFNDWKRLVEDFAGPLPEDIQGYYIKLLQSIQNSAQNSAEEVLDIATNSIVNALGRAIKRGDNEKIIQTMTTEEFEQAKNTFDDMNVGDKLVSITGTLFDIMNDTLTESFNIRLGDRSVDKYKLQNLIVEKTRELERKMAESAANKFTLPPFGARNVGKPLFSAEYLDEWKKSYKANLDEEMQRTVQDEKEKLRTAFEEDFGEKLEQKRLHYEGKLKEYIRRQKTLRQKQWEAEQEQIRKLQEKIRREESDYYDMLDDMEME